MEMHSVRAPEPDGRHATMMKYRSAHPEDRVDMDFNFVSVAKVYCVAFFLTLFIGGIATFTITDFSMKTDKIILYYGFINPCIFFDHFPAKALAMTGLGLFIVVGVLYTFMFFLQEYLERHFFQTVWKAVICVTVTLLDLVFVNVFVTNLYPLETAERRLHGVHMNEEGIVSLVEGPLQMPASEQAMIVLHTLFYILWICGQLWFMFTLFQKHLENAGNRCINAMPIRAKAFFAIALFGMFMHAGAMLVIIVQGEPKVDWYFKDHMKDVMTSSIQHTVIWIDATLGTSLWGWIPIMFYRWVFRPAEGVRLSFSLTPRVGDDGLITPKWWFGRSIQLTAAVFIAGGVFHAEDLSDETLYFKLAAPLRAAPFGYFATPILLGAVILSWTSIGMTCVQQRLLDGFVSWDLIGVGMVMGACELGCLLVVLERERFTKYFFFTGVVLFGVWTHLVGSKRGDEKSGLIYGAVSLVLLILATAFEFWPLYYMFLGWLCIYNYILPDGLGMSLVLSKIEDPTCVELQDQMPPQLQHAQYAQYHHPAQHLQTEDPTCGTC